MARVLVIDDEPLVCDMLSEVLENAGHRPSVAHDGDRGLARYREEAPDVVITDVFMPDKEGIETIKELKQEDPSAKIIAISVGSPIRNCDPIAWAVMAGADFAFRKPIDHGELLKAVDLCLEGSASRA